MFKKLIFLFILNFILFKQIVCSDFPNDIPKCKVSDSQCLKNTLQLVLNNFAKVGHRGINLNVIDPLHIDTLYESTPEEETEFHVTNSNLYGLGDVTVSKFQVLRKRDQVKFDFIMHPKIVRLSGQYEINGRILVVPTEGKGPYNITLDQPTVTVKFLGKLQKIGNDEYFKIDKFLMKFAASKGTINFYNLFNGDPVLGNTVNQFLNYNFKEILNAFDKILFQIFSDILKKITQNIFDTIPYNKMFID